ncbi:MAG: GNAT family N-acetyltransferase [Xanthomonadales bacterium]|nr:GNAT family N-acetyltransferase [Xanthomonadales bacterium]MBP7622668.1 GNAT family N-acetyltransferase [Xanthomonadales bacterium]
MPVLRIAQLDDAKALAALAEATFRDTFSAANTTENMDAHCRVSYGEAAQVREIADASMRTFVAEHEGALVAYAQLRFGPAPACVRGEHPGEILRLYVHRDWHGRGLAQQLMDACLAALRDRGADVAWLGVWEHNPRAIAFYRKFNFTEVGDHIFPVGDDPQRDIVMMRPLSSTLLSEVR